MQEQDLMVVKKFLSMAVMLNELPQETFENVLEQLREEKMEKFFSRREAAELFSCSPAYIDKLCRRGKLRKYFIGGKPLFKKRELLSSIEDQKTQISYQ